MKDDPFADYSASVHGKALLEQGNLSAPGCARCHGAHGASPPGVGDIDKVCGQCHATTRTYFLEGPHKSAMDAAGLPECVSCHENHRILPAGIDRLDSVCLSCHAKESKEVAVAAKMKTLYGASSEELGRARLLVDQAAAIPLYVEDYRARLEEARSSLLEALPVMHALNVAHVEALTARARSIGHEVESELNGKIEGRKWRKIGLMVFWFYLLLTVAILVRMRRAPGGEAPR
jgi:predicted CXXCH cytochrome family protein